MHGQELLIFKSISIAHQMDFYPIIQLDGIKALPKGLRRLGIVSSFEECLVST